jgi:PAS domain S-box-containing protein
MPFPDRHYRALFESMDHGFCTIEVLFNGHGEPCDYRFLDVNGAFELQTGLRDTIGRTMRTLAPDHEAHWFRVYGRVALTGEPVHFEQRAQALGRWYDVNAFRVGEPEQRHVAVLFADITAKKEAQGALYASEARYRALAHATTHLLFRLSADGTQLIEVSGSGVPVRGLEHRPVRVSLEDYLHPDDLPRARTACEEALGGGRAGELEFRARMADLTWGWLLARIVPVRNEAGEVIEWMGSATDITARIEADEALRRSEAAHEAARLAAERANQAKDEFLAILGHELRNPLAPMLTALEVMQLRGSESREQEVLQRQVGYLTRMVDDLLDVSRITRGKVELQRRPLELSDVVVRAMEIASPLFEQRRHRGEMHLPRVGLTIDADLGRMAQVVGNLLTNAAKYSEPGSRIVISGERDRDRVRLRVRDEGIGIEPDMLPTIFEAFVQHPQTSERSAGGLGLGLAIVRSLVEAHGGTVSAESEGPGHGSVFTIELPLLVETGAADAPSKNGSLPDRPPAAAGRLRVLVVDDNEDAADMLRFGLEHLGYEVAIAPDGPSAIERAKTFDPTVAVLDIGLPVMDGYELARKLRADRGGHLRLVALTGYGQDRDRQRARLAGFDTHMVKPVDLERLQRVIEELLAPGSGNGEVRESD